MNKSNTLYKFVESDPLRFFNVSDAEKAHKESYTEEELKQFFFQHYPEKATVEIEEVLTWFDSLKAPVKPLN